MRPYIIGAVFAALIAAGTYLYTRGIADERNRTETNDAIEYRQTRERIDDANSHSRSPDSVLERLRGHAQ